MKINQNLDSWERFCTFHFFISFSISWIYYYKVSCVYSYYYKVSYVYNYGPSFGVISICDKTCTRKGILVKNFYSCKWSFSVAGSAVQDEDKTYWNIQKAEVFVLLCQNRFLRYSTSRKKRNNYIQQIQRFSTSYNTIIIQCTWYNNHLFSFVANPNVRQNLPFIVHETVYGAIQVLQQASFSFSRNTNFATKIPDNKIRPPFCNKKNATFLNFFKNL